MKMLKAATIMSVIGLILVGCVSPPERMKLTSSGKPEITIASTKIDLIKGEIAAAMLSRGFSLTGESSLSLSYARQMDGMQGAMAQMLIGNSYSTTPLAEVQYNIAKLSKDTFIVANISMSTQMAFGQRNRQQMNHNNAWFNEVQTVLNTIKINIEKTFLNNQERIKANRIYMPGRVDGSPKNG